MWLLRKLPAFRSSCSHNKHLLTEPWSWTSVLGCLLLRRNTMAKNKSGRRFISSREVRGLKAGPGGRKWSRKWRSTAANCLSLHVLLSLLSYTPRTTGLEETPPAVAESSSHHQSRKSTTGLPRDQADEGIFSTEMPSKRTLAYVNLIKNLRTSTSNISLISVFWGLTVHRSLRRRDRMAGLRVVRTYSFIPDICLPLPCVLRLKHMPSHLAMVLFYVVLGVGVRASCMLDKHCSNWAKFLSSPFTVNVLISKTI